MVPSTLERWLVDALVPDGPGGVAALAAAEQGGLLTVSARRISFRHELTRRAIMSSIPSARLIALNQRVLAALVERGGRTYRRSSVTPRGWPRQAWMPRRRRGARP